MERPKLIPHLKNADKALNIAAFIALAVLWAQASSAYFHLPDVVPTHFNFKGEADAFGSPDSIFIGPAIGSVLFVLMTILLRYPYKMSYNVTITPENAAFHYATASRMIRYLRFSIMLLFIGIEYVTIHTAHNPEFEIGGWFIAVIMVFIHFPVFFFMIKMSSHGETK